MSAKDAAGSEVPPELRVLNAWNSAERRLRALADRRHLRHAHHPRSAMPEAYIQALGVEPKLAAQLRELSAAERSVHHASAMPNPKQAEAHEKLAAAVVRGIEAM